MAINGAAAHLMNVGDLVIILTYTEMDDVAARVWQPRLVYVNSENRIQRTIGVPEQAVEAAS